VSTPADVLRSRDLRVTAARIAVLEVLDERGHQTVDEITAGVRDRIGSVSVQAVYHVLGALAAAQLVRRIEPAGSAARYERRVGDNHHHLVCRSCGHVVDVDCRSDSGAPCLEPADRAGFEVEEAELVFWGTCPACTATTRTERSSS
jgi:Fur family ferric uptake transcriptional regulator